ncbi:MAG: hypothetical protein JW745_07110 [Sedimentisphaerales bacterium]|nr:hypothetical protein [Sedimentisphaerales bacterium]MBN2844220.1 hypothetical protein [Sedimentisphaerales bacterium]
MRIIAAVLVWVVIIGLVVSFQNYSKAQSQKLWHGQDTPIELSQILYTLELTATFAPASDSFALTVSEVKSEPLQITMAGKSLISAALDLQPGKPQLTDLDGIVVGHNELLVKALVPQSYSGTSQALRAVVYANGAIIAQETFWSVPGGDITGTLNFEVKKERVQHDSH